MAKERAPRRPQALVTKVQTVLSQQQSQEMVQIMLYGSISVLAYYRNLFPDSVYFDCVVADDARPLTYEDFICDHRSSEDADQPSSEKHCARVKLLRKGKSVRVDTFIEMMEKSIFDALHHKVLKKLHIRVVADDQHPHQVLEIYTFAIRYTDTERGLEVAGLEFECPDGVWNQGYDAQEDLVALFLRLSDHCDNTMSQLPERRYISVKIDYADEHNSEYEPPGFQEVYDDDEVFPETDGWIKRTEDVGIARGGLHSMALTISYLDDLSASGRTIPQSPEYGKMEDTSKNIAMFTTTPQTSTNAIEFVTDHTPTPSTVCAVDEMDTDLKLQAGSAGELDNSRSDPTQLNVESPYLEDANDKHVMRGLQGVHAKPNVEAPKDSRMSQNESQLVEDSRVQLSLQKMLAPNHDTQNATATQPRLGILCERNAVHGINREDVGSTNKEHMQAYCFLSQRKADQLSKMVSPSRDIPARSQSLVICMCRSRQAEQDMCHVCARLQHLHCYGFIGMNDPRHVQIHVCYCCLLDPQEQRVLTELRDIALQRQAMHLILNDRVSADSILAPHLGLTEDVCSTVTDSLKIKGLVVKHGRHTRRSQGPQLSLPDEVQEMKYRKGLLQELFDPLLHVGHHYQLSTASTASMQQIEQVLMKNYPCVAPPQNSSKRHCDDKTLFLNPHNSEALDEPGAMSSKRARRSTSLRRDKLRTPTRSNRTTQTRQFISRLVVDASSIPSPTIDAGT